MPDCCLRADWPTRPLCPGNGLYPDPSDCSYYLSCEHQGTVWARMHRMPCSPPLVFNPDSGQCDWKSNVPRCQ